MRHKSRHRGSAYNRSTCDVVMDTNSVATYLQQYWLNKQRCSISDKLLKGRVTQYHAGRGAERIIEVAVNARPCNRSTQSKHAICLLLVFDCFCGLCLMAHNARTSLVFTCARESWPGSLGVLHATNNPRFCFSRETPLKAERRMIPVEDHHVVGRPPLSSVQRYRSSLNM